MLHRIVLAEVTFAHSHGLPFAFRIFLLNAQLISSSSVWSLYLLFLPFPFRFSLSSLHPEFLSPLRVISLFVSFLVSLCGPYCSASGMKPLSLPSVLCISAQVPGCITLTSSFFSGRVNVAYWLFSLCWRCAGFSPTLIIAPKQRLASQDSCRRPLP